MSEENLLIAGEKFHAIVNGCMAVLEKHGLTPQPPPSTDVRFRNIFKDRCFDFYCIDVAEGLDAPMPSKLKINLTGKQLDQIALECALVFLREGMKDMHYNESLNCLRATIEDVIVEMGYDRYSFRRDIPPQIWSCYQLWEEVARRDFLDNREIAERRRWSREKYREYYEAA